MTPLSSWVLRQTDEVERSFVLPTHSKALDFIVRSVEIVEEAGLELGLWLQGGHVRISVAIPGGGAPESFNDVLHAIEDSAHDT